MLLTNSSNRVTFNVNVMGTAASPAVRCVIGESPTLMFPAVKVADGWEVLIDLPADFKQGVHPFRVEVIVNGRIFTPINKTIEVGLGEVQDAAPSVEVSDVAVAPITSTEFKQDPVVAPIATPAPDPVKQKTLSTLIKAVTAPPRIDAEVRPRVKIPEAPKVPAKKVEIPIVRKTEAAQDFAALMKIAKKPRSVTTEVKNIRFTMADVANAVAESEPVRAPNTKSKNVQVQEDRGAPVVLIKGNIVYR